MTERRDVVVIGGGLAGTAVAYFLACEGVDVLLLEQFDLNTQASGSNAGSIHLQLPMAEFTTLGHKWASEFAPTLSMLKAGADLWAELPGKLETELEYQRSGGIIVARSAAEFECVRAKTHLEQQYGVDVRLLDSVELREMAPYLTTDVVGGAYCAGEGKANPLLATLAFARAAVANGAEIRTLCKVTGIDEQSGGFLIRTQDYDVKASRVINSAGASAGEIAAMLGIDVAIRGFPIQVAVTEAITSMIKHLVYSAAGRLTLKQMVNGTCLIGGGWPSTVNANGTLRVNEQSLAANMALAMAVVPQLGSVDIVRTWPAIVNGTDDWRPLIGEVRRHRGFFLNLFPWMGFTAGPIAAMVTAELVLGRRPSVDLQHISAIGQ